MPDGELNQIGYFADAQFEVNIFAVGLHRLDTQVNPPSKRVMHPTKANADGSYTYAFIMDPVVEGGEYDIKKLTEKMYGKAKGDDYYKLFADALKPGNNYHEFILKQSKD